MTNLKSNQLLIAEPFMEDPNFKRAVVLLCQHDTDGSFGFILNRKLDLRLGDAVPELEALDMKLFAGGPVQPDTLHYIHNYGDSLKDAHKIDDNVYWGGDFEQLKAMANTGMIETERIRFFLGYSGWDNGQLETETTSDSWILSKPKYDHIFKVQPAQLWHQVLFNMGGEYRVMSHFPDDPILN